MYFTDDKPVEECGVIGLWNRNTSNFDTANTLFLGLYGIQHRGQQSCGLAINDKGKIIYHKELGLVTSNFDEIVLNHLKGGVAGVGHVGYMTGEQLSRENVLPFMVRYKKGQMAISYNGCILNADKLRDELESQGFVFQTSSDAEIVAFLLNKERIGVHSTEEALLKAMSRIKGSYAMLILTPHKLIAVRDGYGVKPLCIGQLDDSFIFASESAALDTVGAKFIRDVLPGEIVISDDEGLKSLTVPSLGPNFKKSSMCIFEFVYFARADSSIDGVSVHAARFEAGKTLAKEWPAEADVVIGVPDSGLSAAMGYGEESGIHYTMGIMKNRYITRTFIQPEQGERELAVGLKLNAIRHELEGKRVVLVDDSIVRGTTSKKLVEMLRQLGGAKEVHVRIASPLVKYSCYYGIDTHYHDSLIANRMSVEEICRYIGADSLGFISPEGMLSSPVGAKCGFCSACFDGRYPIEN